MSEEKSATQELQESVDKAFEFDWGWVGEAAGDVADAVGDAAAAVYEFFTEDDPEYIELPDHMDPNLGGFVYGSG